MQPMIPFAKLLEIQRETNQPERLALYAPRPGDEPDEFNPHKPPARPIKQDDEAQRGVAIIDFSV